MTVAADELIERALNGDMDESCDGVEQVIAERRELAQRVVNLITTYNLKVDDFAAETRRNSELRAVLSELCDYDVIGEQYQDALRRGRAVLGLED